MELDDVLGPPPLALGAGEEAGAEAVLGEQVAHRPVRQGEHPPPLAEDDDLAALLQHELPDELAELQELGGREALDHALLGGARADRRPDLLEAELGQAVGDDPLGGQQAHQAEELGLGQRPGLGPLDELGDRLDQRVVLLELRLGHLDGHADVGPRRELVEHVLADPADHAGLEPLAERVEVADAGDLAAAVGVDGVERRSAATWAPAPCRRPTRRSRPAPRSGSPSACRSAPGGRAGPAP